MPETPDSRSQALFGRIAVDRGFVSAQQLETVLKLYQQLGGSHPLGALFVQRGLLTIGQVQEILAIQKQHDARMGQAAAAAPASAAPAATQPRPTPQASVPAPARPAVQAPPPAPARVATAPQSAAPPARITTPVPGSTGVPPARQPLGVQPAAPPAPLIARGAPTAPVAGPTPPVATPPPEPAAAPPPKKTFDLSPLLKPGVKHINRVAAMIEVAEKRGASDIHFHSGTPPVLRLEGALTVLEDAPLSPADLERDLMMMLSEYERRVFAEAGELDFAFVAPNGLRTRANLYRAHAGLDAIFRVLPRGPQSLEELGLPSQLSRLVGYHQGLVLVTGPAGGGKSTTLSALVNLINEDRSEHVLLLEDPIEIVHPSKKALINQRQVGRDTDSFARALRGALREDPDVIVIGDLRDRETISLAITAAETGHLVIGSMNTNNAARTVGRIIDAFPPVQQGQVRAMISESLRGVVSQKLVMGIDGKRVPAMELLFNTPAIANVIRKGELFQIRSQMQVGKSVGMRTFDEALREHVLNSRMEAEEARKWADNPAFIPSGPAPVAPPAPAAPPGKPGVMVIPSGPAKPDAAPNPPARTGLGFFNRSGSRS